MHCSKSTCAIAILALSACQREQPFRQEFLTSNGEGKYWDKVYSTNIYGHVNISYSHRYVAQDQYKSSVTASCTYFSKSGSVIHYNNLDSLRVINSNYNTDVLYNPDKFVIVDSVIEFMGHTHKILTLNTEIMLLEYQHNHKKALSIYIPSKYQNKIEVIPKATE